MHRFFRKSNPTRGDYAGLLAFAVAYATIISLVVAS